MTSVPHVEPPPRRDPGRRLSTFFVRHDGLRLGALLAAPLGWLLVIYLGSLFVLFLAAFWSIGGILGTEVVHDVDARQLQRDRRRARLPGRRRADDQRWRARDGRGRGARVPDRVLHGARRDAARRGILVVAVLIPLWASYLVKVYTWRTILAEQTESSTGRSTPFGLDGPGYVDVRALARVHVPLAAVHDHAHLRGARAHPGVAARGVGRSRRTVG